MRRLSRDIRCYLTVTAPLAAAWSIACLTGVI